MTDSNDTSSSSEDEVGSGEEDTIASDEDGGAVGRIARVVPYAHEPLPLPGAANEARRRQIRQEQQGYPEREGNEW